MGIIGMAQSLGLYLDVGIVNTGRLEITPTEHKQTCTCGHTIQRSHSWTGKKIDTLYHRKYCEACGYNAGCEAHSLYVMLPGGYNWDGTKFRSILACRYCEALTIPH